MAIRLLGVALSNLESADAPLQLALPFEAPKPVGKVMDGVRRKFGYDSVHLGRGAKRKPASAHSAGS